MPLDPSKIALAIQAAGPEIQGPVWARFTLAVGIGFSAWALTPGNVMVTGVTTGAAGVGAVVGKLSVVPFPLPVNMSMSAATVLGLDATPIGRAVGMGVCTTINTSATYVGVSSGVGMGADVSKVGYADIPNLMLALSSAFAGMGYTGSDVARLSSGLAPGLTVLLLTGSGVGIVSGPVGPSPAVGVSTSQIT